LTVAPRLDGDACSRHQLLQSFQRHCTRLTRDFFTSLEYNSGRDASDVEAGGRARRMVGVEFRDECLALQMRGESIDGWRHHSTRAAPVGVEIDGDWHVAIADGS